MRKLQTIAILGLALITLPHCGQKEQNPLHGYTVANTAVPPEQRDRRTITERVQTHKIEALDDLQFIEGQEKSVRFKVTLLAAHPDETKIELKQDDLLKAMGATLRKTAADVWTLSWKPSLNILPSTRDSARFDLKLKLDVLASSSARAKAQFPAGTDLTREFLVTLSKDQSVPKFADRILLSNGSKLSLGQKTEVRFQVSAGQIDGAEDLEIQLNPESQKPSRELLQASGAYGVAEAPEAIATRQEGVEKVVTYKLTFDSQKFWEQVLEDIQAEPRLIQKLQSAEYLTAEARLVIHAKNKKTGRSQTREVFIDVDLGFKPGAPELISTETLVVASKRTKIDTLAVKADNGQGNLSVVTATINDTAATESKGSFSLDVAAATVTLRCTPANSKDLREKCQTGACVLNCRTTVKAKCAAEDTTLNLQLKVKSTVRHQEVEGVVTRQIQIQKSQKTCEGAQS